MEYIPLVVEDNSSTEVCLVEEVDRPMSVGSGLMEAAVGSW